MHSIGNHGKNTFILSSNPAAGTNIEEQIRNDILSSNNHHNEQ